MEGKWKLIGKGMESKMMIGLFGKDEPRMEDGSRKRLGNRKRRSMRKKLIKNK